jgi:hypothetical protein
MDVKEIGWGGVNRIHLAQHRENWRDIVNSIMNIAFLKILEHS